MLNRLLGKKIGMTQIFDENRKVIPVTVIDVGGWVLTQIKTQENDGYDALQLALVKKKYRDKQFSQEWLKKKKIYFSHVKEVLLDEKAGDAFSVGQEISFENASIEENNYVDVAGTSRGLGFQGVIKRWGFAGGPGGHGSNFHRKPGSIGNMCSQGKVVKGKKLPGHCGCKRITVKNLQVVRFDKECGCLFIRGPVPGKKETLLSISRKQG